MFQMSHFRHLLRIKSRIVRKPLRTLFLRHEEFPHFFLVWGLVTGKGRAALDIFADIEVVHQAVADVS